METRARFVLLGFFLLAVIVAGFGFVYWLNYAGTAGEQALYRVRFQGTVSGLRPGSAVLFNGIRVGEVRSLQIDPASPREVLVLISVERRTPLRGDTQAEIYSQGLMGSPAVSLLGGGSDAPLLAAPAGAEPPILEAAPDAGQDMTVAARAALRHLDTILTENAQPLRDTISNLKSFSDALARNSARIDSIAQGLDRTFGGGDKPKLSIYDLAAPKALARPEKMPTVQIAVVEPTAVLQLDTQKILAETGLVDGGSFENAQWSDSLPKLFLARILQSFENAGFANAIRDEMGSEADFKLVVDLRSVRLVKGAAPAGEVEFGARIVTRDGKVAGFELFRASAPAAQVTAEGAANAINAAFAETMKALVTWTLKITGS